MCTTRNYFTHKSKYISYGYCLRDLEQQCDRQHKLQHWDTWRSVVSVWFLFYHIFNKYNSKCGIIYVFKLMLETIHTLNFFIGCSIYVCSCSTPSFSSPSFSSPANSSHTILYVNKFLVYEHGHTHAHTNRSKTVYRRRLIAEGIKVPGLSQWAAIRSFNQSASFYPLCSGSRHGHCSGHYLRLQIVSLLRMTWSQYSFFHPTAATSSIGTAAFPTLY